MSTLVLAFATGITQHWVRLYTAGLEPGLRDERRAEVASDVWEETHDATRPRGETSVAAGVLGRWLTGLADDLSWRLAHARAGALPLRAAQAALRRLAAAGTWVTHRGLPGLTWGAAGLALLLGAILLITTFTGGNQNENALAGAIILLILGGLTVTGLRLSARRPRAAAALVIGGVAPMALALWTTLVAPLLAAAIAWSAIARARRVRALRS